MADNYSSKEQDLISNLPNEVLVHILKNLDYCHFLAVRHVSTRFKILSNYFVLAQRMINKQELSTFFPLSFVNLPNESPCTDTNLDRHLILGHPLLPFLELLSRKCELATVSNTLPSYNSFEEEFHLLKNQIKMKKPYYIANDEVDKLMINAIDVQRFHLLELLKVHELSENFCSRYVTALRPNPVPNIAYCGTCTEIPYNIATYFCSDCNEKICLDCKRGHEIFRLTRDHVISPMPSLYSSLIVEDSFADI